MRTISHRHTNPAHQSVMPEAQTGPRLHRGNSNTDLVDAETALPDTVENTAAESLLANPIWNSLRTDHRALAVGTGRARRYPTEVGPLSGIPDQSEESFDDLRSLTGPGGVLALFFPEPLPPPPEGWTLLRHAPLSQMIWRGPKPQNPLSPSGVNLRQLSAADVPEMLALAELTEPGPFRQRTIELGTFYGVFDAGRLVAMAGQRMRMPGFIEVSAVCTHPDARGRGLARTLSTTVMHDIFEQQRTPFLHVLPENYSAIRIYENLGFELSRTFHFAVLKKNA